MGGMIIPERSSLNGAQRVSIEKPDHASTTLVSHDWCDPCTWYQKSVKIEGETLTFESGKTYASSASKWIDLTHGRMSDEDDVAATYIPKVYDDGQLLTLNDYSINYDLGKVTLSENYTPNGAITATFYKPTSSEFLLEPTAGKILVLEHAELNVSKDCMVNVPINFEIWVGNPNFNQQQPESEVNPLRILYKKKRYKNPKDLINAANLGQGEISQWGGLPHPILIFPFNYITLQPLRASQLSQLRIRLDKDQNGNDVPLTGSWGTCSFYVMSLKE